MVTEALLEYRQDIQIIECKEPSLLVWASISLEASINLGWQISNVHQKGFTAFPEKGNSAKKIKIGIETDTGMVINVGNDVAILDVFFIEFEKVKAIRQKAAKGHGGLKSEDKKQASRCFVPVQPLGSKSPLYLVHPLSGEVDYLFEMKPYFDLDQPIFGLQSVGFDGKEPMLSTIESMAEHYVKLILEHNPDGPYCLGGFSLGGLVAYEMAIQLKKKGKDVKTLILLDSYPHKEGKFTYLHFPVPYVLKSWQKYISNTRIPLTRRVQKVKQRVPGLWNDIKTKIDKLIYRRGPSFPAHIEQTIDHKLKVNNFMAHWAYEIKPYDGKVIFFRAIIGPVRYLRNFDFGWKKYINDLDIVDLEGDHYVFLKIPANLKKIVAKIKEYV